MGLRFDPVGGGQFKQALKQIIEVESQPIKALETRKAREEARLKLFQEFKNKFNGIDKAIGEMATFKKLRELKADLGDGANIMSVSIDKERAEVGSYQIQVDQLAAKTSVISNGFEDADDPSLGIGFVVMETPSGTQEIFVDEGQASLRGVANLINRQGNCPVHASVIKDSSDPEAPYKLILAAKKDGAVNQIDFPEFYFLDGTKDFYIDDNNKAKNGLIQMDGFPIEIDSNDINDFLQGINVHLRQAKPDQPFTLTISEDYQKITSKMKAAVDQINGILQFINQQNAVDQHTDTKTTFTGDTGLQTIEYRLRNLMHEGFVVYDPSADEGEYRLVFMNQLGIEFEKNGMLSFKEDRFVKGMEQDFEGVSQAISGDFGFAFQVRELLKNYTTPSTGLLATREGGIRARIKDIDSQIESKGRNLERKQQSLTEQFSRLEASLGNLQRQQQYLNSTLGGGGGGNMVAQLLGG